MIIRFSVRSSSRKLKRPFLIIKLKFDYRFECSIVLNIMGILFVIDKLDKRSLPNNLWQMQARSQNNPSEEVSSRGRGVLGHLWTLTLTFPKNDKI